MAVKDILKDQKHKFQMQSDYVFFVLFFILIATVSVFLLFGVSLEKSFGWNIWYAINAYDYQLGGFFHKLFKLIKEFFISFGVLKDMGFHYWIMFLKAQFASILHTDPVNFLPSGFLKQMHSKKELEDITHQYFMMFNAYIIMFIFIQGYFFRNKLISLIPQKIRNMIYTYTINLLVFPLYSEKDLKEFKYSDGAFFYNFEKNFLEREIEIVDGYPRNRNLQIMDKFPTVWATGRKEGQIDTTKYRKEYNYLLQAFKNPDELLDLMRIIEGYLLKDGKPYLFDEYIDKMTYDEYKKFRAFNGTDCVYFSFPINFKDI